MRYTALATCSLLMLTSCAQTFQVQPAPILTQSDMKTILAEYSEEASIQKFYSQDAGARNGRTPEAYRDSIIALYISALDQRYYAWVGDVSKGSKGIDTGTATAALALSSAASLAGVAAAHALAAASSVVSGTGAIVNQKIFFEKTFPALRASMDASRDEVKATIFKKFGSTAQSYTIEMAFADLFEYQEASSLDTAIQRLTTGAALDHQVQATSAAGAGAAGAPAPGGGAPPGPPPAASAIVAPPPPYDPGNPPAVTANAAYRSEIAIAPVSQPQVISGQLAPPPAGSPQCSDGWRITGYYTPREADLPGPATQIQVSNVGSASFSQSSFKRSERRAGVRRMTAGILAGREDGQRVQQRSIRMAVS